MKHIKTFEGLFSKSKPDNDIALMLINILERGEYTNLDHYSTVYTCEIDGIRLLVDKDLPLNIYVTYKKQDLNLSLNVASKLYKTMKTLYQKEKEMEKQDIRDSLQPYNREADKFGF